MKLTAPATIALTFAISMSMPQPAAAASRAEMEDRFAAADAVVVATVCAIDAAFRINDLGRQIIVSQATLCPKEVLKGDPTGVYILEIEGGTVGGVTMGVSSLPLLHVGDRALFLLTQNGSSPRSFQLASGGLGFFEIDDATQRISDYYNTLTVTLTTVRSIARDALRGR